MQEMISSVCHGAEYGEKGQLIDGRDSKKYWVAKLHDGNCWMTQNLDLDLNTSKPLTSASSDVPNSWTPTTNTQTSASPSGFSANNEITSWDPAKGGAATYCPSSKCNTTSTTSGNNGHAAQGNYYTWAAATAGQAASLVSNTAGEQSTQSICPKGWRLPTGSANGEFYNLVNGLTVAQITIAPYYFVYGGYVGGSNLNDAGSNGYYWSSTAFSGTQAYLLSFSTSVNPSNNSGRHLGMSVRCVAR